MTDKKEAQAEAQAIAQEQHERTVERSVRFLCNQFQKITAGMGRATRANGNQPATDLYGYQVEFSYMIDAIQRGPRHFAPKVISDCNEFLDTISQAKAEAAALKTTQRRPARK